MMKTASWSMFEVSAREGETPSFGTLCRTVPVILVVGALLSLCAFSASAAGPAEFHLSMGYSNRGVFNANRQDARAALAVLTRKIVQNNSWTGESHVYDTLDEMERDVREKRVHLLGILPDEYLELKKKVPLDPIAAAQGEKGVNFGLVLLVRKDSGIRTLGDLKGRSIAITGRSRHLGNIYHTWLETLMMKAGYGWQEESFFSNVKLVQDPTQVIMPVFFHQTDACVATRQLFENAAELNPQIEQKLAPIAAIDNLSPGLIVIDQRLPAGIKRKLTQIITSLHETPEGRQMMLMFKVTKLIPYRREYLAGTEALLSENRSLRTLDGTVKRRKSK